MTARLLLEPLVAVVAVAFVGCSRFVAGDVAVAAGPGHSAAADSSTQVS
jgi:hypothetical protein